MPPSDLTDAEQAELYFRRGLTLLWGVPITTPAIQEHARMMRRIAQYLAHCPPRWQGTVLMQWHRGGGVTLSHTGSAWENETAQGA